MRWRGVGVCEQGPDKKNYCGQGPVKIFLIALDFSGKIFGANVNGPEFFYTNRFCREFFLPEQPDTISRPCAVGRGRALADRADPGPYLVPDPSSIVGTGGTEERWQSAGKIITITEITNQKNPDFSLKNGIFSSNIPQLPPALSQTTHQNPEPRSSGGPKKPATDL